MGDAAGDRGVGAEAGRCISGLLAQARRCTRALCAWRWGMGLAHSGLVRCWACCYSRGSGRRLKIVICYQPIRARPRWGRRRLFTRGEDADPPALMTVPLCVRLAG